MLRGGPLAIRHAQQRFERGWNVASLRALRCRGAGDSESSQRTRVVAAEEHRYFEMPGSDRDFRDEDGLVRFARAAGATPAGLRITVDGRARAGLFAEVV